MFTNIRFPAPALALAVILTLGACDQSSPNAEMVTMARPGSRTMPARMAEQKAALRVAAPEVANSTIGVVSRAGFAGVVNPNAANADEEAQPAPQVPTATPQDVTPGAMLVRTGQASLQVDSLDVGLARVREVARRTNAIIANTSMEGGHDQTRAATLELRIPSARFDEAVSGLSPIGKVESVNVTVEDVGEEYVDVAARVANARRLEQRLVELLANRTGKLSDVLRVERELARVREEIERYEGRIRYLRSRASVSTLSVSLHEPLPIVADRPGTHPMRDAFVQAWRNVIGFTAGTIAALGVIIPLGLIIGILIFVGRRWLPARALGLTKTTSTGSA